MELLNIKLKIIFEERINFSLLIEKILIKSWSEIIELIRVRYSIIIAAKTSSLNFKLSMINLKQALRVKHRPSVKLTTSILIRI